MKYLLLLLFLFVGCTYNCDCCKDCCRSKCPADCKEKAE